MVRYIDVSELPNFEITCSDGKKYVLLPFERLSDIPTADVVEVVRCKDCKLSSEPKMVSRYDLYCNDYDVYYCEKKRKIVRGTHYCSYGERK